MTLARKTSYEMKMKLLCSTLALAALGTTALVGLVGCGKSDAETVIQVDRPTRDPKAPKAASITWYSNFDRARDEARKAGKPLMVDFYADWCTWCKELDTQVYTMPSVIDAAQDFVSVKVDSDRNPELSMKYRAESLPLIVFMDAEGRVLHRVEGFMDAPKFKAEMDRVFR